MSPPSSGSRNSRGLGLPGCACTVTLPTSTKPNPSAAQAGIATAFLSKPAARPTGLGKLRPNARTLARVRHRAGRADDPERGGVLGGPGKHLHHALVHPLGVLPEEVGLEAAIHTFSIGLSVWSYTEDRGGFEP